MRYIYFILIFLVNMSIAAGALSVETDKEKVNGEAEVFEIVEIEETEPVEDLPADITVITREQIIQSGAQDLGELLRYHPSINIGRYGNLGALSSISMRGSTAEQVLVLIDGRPVNDTTFGTALAHQILLLHVERVEIMPGGTSDRYYAAAAGGVINVITRKPDSELPVTDISITFGNLQKKLYHYGFSKKIKQAEIYVSGDKHSSDGFRDNGNVRLNHVFAHIGYDLNRFGKLVIKGDLYRGISGVPGTNTTPLALWNDDLEKKATTLHTERQSDNRYGFIEYALPVSGIINLRTRVYGNVDEKKFIFENSQLNQFYENKSVGSETELKLPLHITIGGDYRHDSFFQKEIVSNQQTANRKFINRAYYIRQTLSLDSLTLTPGVRYDDHSDFDPEINPRLTMTYTVSEETVLSAHGARSFRAPTFNEVIANSAIQPEIGAGYDIGIAKKSQNKSRQIRFFLNNTKELIVWEQNIVSRLWEPVNTPGKIRAHGVEINTRRAVSSWMSHTIGYTYTSVRNRETGKTVPYKPAHKLNYTLEIFNTRGSKATIYAEGVGRQYSNKNMSSSIPGYGLVDLKLQQKMYTFEIAVGIDNILDKRYLNRVNFPLAGRTFYGTVSIRLVN